MPLMKAPAPKVPARAAAPAPAARPAPPAAARPAPKPAAPPAAAAPKPATTAAAHPTSAVTQILDKVIVDLQSIRSTLTGGAAAPKAAAPSAAPKVAGGPAAPKPAVRPAPPRAPSTPPAAAPATQETATEGGAVDLTSMNRAQLVAMADQYGVAHVGLKADDLRKALAEVMGGAAPAAEEGAAAPEAGTLSPLAEAQAGTVMQLITENSDRYAEMISPEGQLKCGGDCARCPNPEGYENADQQIAACHKAIHDDLGIEETQYA